MEEDDCIIEITERKKRFIKIIAALGIAGVMCHASNLITCPTIPQKYRFFVINKTPSIPMGLYIRIPTWNLKDGDYVLYRPNEQTVNIAMARGWMKSEQLFLKRIAAKEKESFSIDLDANAFYANGKYHGQIFRKDKNGEELPIAGKGSLTVPHGEFLPYGTHPQSFDGRYTGCVSTKNIYFKLIPVITY